jgi:eukaryotic-like serine/threonine-protein kinase
MKGELESGSTLGRYELLVRLGRGGMASVWVARERLAHSGSQRLVAVKAMLPELAKSSDFRSMFLEEGGLVRAIEHQNVVRVFEVAEDSGILFMAMEWIEGDSLRTVMREAMRRRPIPPEMTVRMIADTAAGLHAAHELRGWDGELRGIVHCDVSPHNILVGIDGAARLVDFGVARAMAFGSLAGGGVIRGKFGYMSPEQARGRSIDRRSDVFSLGICLFELLTGERLFKGRDKQQTVDLVATGDIPPPSELNPKVPSGLDPIVLKALERDRRVRYQTAEEFRQALDRWLVEQRILVSQAGVAQLVQRVLASTIEQRREAIREALVMADGKLAVSLVSELPAMEPGLVSDSEHESMSISVASLSSISGSSANAWRARPSSPPMSTPSHSHSSTGTARPQVFDAPKKSRPSLLLALGTMAGAAAGAAAVLWALQHRASRPDESRGEPIGTTTSAAAAAASPGTSASAGEGNGLSIDSLPLAVDEAKSAKAADPRRPIKPKTKPGTGPTTTPEEPAQPVAPSPIESAKPEPAAEPAGDVPEEPVTLPEETEKPKKKPATASAEEAPSGPLAPLNRGAAIAALGSAASSVARCKQEDGPSGSGRASVTFAPNGSVVSVGLPGKFAGTAVGNCIQGLYRKAKLQPFSGGPVTLSSSFNVPE